MCATKVKWDDIETSSSQLTIMLFNLIVLNEINLFLDYQLFSSCLFDDINGPVELLSLETPIVDFFPWRASTMGATNSSSSFETILLVTQRASAAWFISVLQKWDAVHNNIQGRRKIGKLSLMLRELI